MYDHSSQEKFFWWYFVGIFLLPAFVCSLLSPLIVWLHLLCKLSLDTWRQQEDLPLGTSSQGSIKPFFICQVFQPLNLVGPLLDLMHYVRVFPVMESSKLDMELQMRSGDQNRGFPLFWVCNFLCPAGCILARVDQNVINHLCAGPLLTCVPSLLYQHLQVHFLQSCVVFCQHSAYIVAWELLHPSCMTWHLPSGFLPTQFSWRFTEWLTALSFSLLTCPSEFNVVE